MIYIYDINIYIYIPIKIFRHKPPKSTSGCSPHEPFPHLVVGDQLLRGVVLQGPSLQAGNHSVRRLGRCRHFAADINGFPLENHRKTIGTW